MTRKNPPMKKPANVVPSFAFTFDGMNLYASQKGVYHDGTPAVMVDSEDGEGPWCVLTVCVTGAQLGPGEILVKGWSENGPTVSRLLELGILKPTGRVVPTGYVEAQVCTVHAPSA